MKCVQIVAVNILLIGFSSCYLTPSLVTERYVEPDIIETNPNKSNDTLIFAQVVSI